MKTKTLKRLSIVSVAVLMLQALGFAITLPAYASGSPWSYVSIRFDRMQASTQSTGTICASFSASNITAISGAGTTLAVQFPSDTTLSTTNGNWSIDTTSNASWPSGAAAWTGLSAPSGGTGVDNTTKTVNFNVTNASNPSSSGVYCFNWNNSASLQTGSSGNNKTGTISFNSGTYPGSTAILTSNWATAWLAGDQVTVNATVPPTFVFTLNSTSTPFSSNLDPSTTISTSSNNVSVSTNAASGYVIYTKDLKFKSVTDSGSSPSNRHGALQSTTAGNYSIANNTTNSLGSAAHFANSTQGNEDYGLAITSVTGGGGGQAGTPSADAAFDSTSSATCTTSTNSCLMGVLDATQYRPVGSSNGTSNGDVFNFVERANIKGITPAGSDYTDTLTFVAAGKF